MSASVLLMATRLIGADAIALAEKLGTTVNLHGAPGAPAREGVSPSEARAIAASHPERVYLDIDEVSGDPNVGVA